MQLTVVTSHLSSIRTAKHQTMVNTRSSAVRKKLLLPFHINSYRNSHRIIILTPVFTDSFMVIKTTNILTDYLRSILTSSTARKKKFLKHGRSAQNPLINNSLMKKLLTKLFLTRGKQKLILQKKEKRIYEDKSENIKRNVKDASQLKRLRKKDQSVKDLRKNGQREKRQKRLKKKTKKKRKMKVKHKNEFVYYSHSIINTRLTISMRVVEVRSNFNRVSVLKYFFRLLTNMINNYLINILI